MFKKLFSVVCFLLFFVLTFTPVIFSNQLEGGFGYLPENLIQTEETTKTPMENGEIVTKFKDFVIVEYTSFVNRNDYSLYGTVFLPAEAYENPSGKKYPFVFLAYGTACTNRFYGVLFRELAKSGYVVAGIDYQGQGYSSGPAPYKDGMVDSEVYADDILEFQQYLFDNSYPIDENRMGIWGWSLGTMVTPGVIYKDPRYKAVSQMGVIYDNSVAASTTHWEKYLKSINIPLQIEMTMASMHDSWIVTPWFDPAVDLFEDYSGEAMLIVHDPAPMAPLTFAGFMSENRVYHYINEVIDFFNYFLSGDKESYARLIAPDPYCTKIGKSYKFKNDQRLLTEDEWSFINRVRKTAGNIHDGSWFSRYVFFPTWERLVIPTLSYVDMPMEYATRLLLPWDLMWNFGMEYFEMNHEELAPAN